MGKGGSGRERKQPTGRSESERERERAGAKIKKEREREGAKIKKEREREGAKITKEREREGAKKKTDSLANRSRAKNARSLRSELRSGAEGAERSEVATLLRNSRNGYLLNFSREKHRIFE